MNDTILYTVALTLIPQIGNKYARQIIAHLGNAEELFKLNKKDLLQLKMLTEEIRQNILNKTFISHAEKELAFADKNNIDILYYTDSNYPTRLKHCNDAPLILYSKGKLVHNTQKAISIVGTRNITSYGEQVCAKLVADLKKHNALIISGLAFGVDSCAHSNALKNKLNTVAVLGHPLNMIYPAQNKDLAKQIVSNGALLTEFPLLTNGHKSNFVKRNRIIAGMADATIIIESAKQGGSLISAEFANSYNRDVFAIPGKTNDKYSQGCNNLIKKNKAHLLESVEDIEYIMNWESSENKELKQIKIFAELNETEQIIADAFPDSNMEYLDNLVLKTKLPVSTVSSHLLNMEFKGIIKSLPGKKYQYIF